MVGWWMVSPLSAALLHFWIYRLIWIALKKIWRIWIDAKHQLSEVFLLRFCRLSYLTLKLKQFHAEILEDLSLFVISLSITTVLGGWAQGEDISKLPTCGKYNTFFCVLHSYRNLEMWAKSIVLARLWAIEWSCVIWNFSSFSLDTLVSTS